MHTICHARCSIATVASCAAVPQLICRQRLLRSQALDPVYALRHGAEGAEAQHLAGGTQIQRFGDVGADAHLAQCEDERLRGNPEEFSSAAKRPRLVSTPPALQMSGGGRTLCVLVPMHTG